jgi:hypothetical protein
MLAAWAHLTLAPAVGPRAGPIQHTEPESWHLDAVVQRDQRTSSRHGYGRSSVLIAQRSSIAR